MLLVSGYCEDEGFPLPGHPSVFDLINRDIETYGALFGTRDTATRSVADLRGRLGRAQEQTRNSPQTPTAALYMYEPLGAYGNNAVVHEQLSILGLKNVFADTNKRYFEPSVEEIIARNPELVIALYTPRAITPAHPTERHPKPAKPPRAGGHHGHPRQRDHPVLVLLQRSRATRR